MGSPRKTRDTCGCMSNAIMTLVIVAKDSFTESFGLGNYEGRILGSISAMIIFVGFLLGFAGALRVNRYAMVAGAGIAFAGAVLAFIAGLIP